MANETNGNFVVDPYSVLNTGLDWGASAQSFGEGLRFYSYDSRLVAAAIKQLIAQVRRIADLMDPKEQKRAKEIEDNHRRFRYCYDSVTEFMKREKVPFSAREEIRSILKKMFGRTSYTNEDVVKFQHRVDKVIASFKFPKTVSKPGTKVHKTYAAWIAQRSKR